MPFYLNRVGYRPIDDDSETGFRRPPRDPACIGDYFAILMELEDEGAFLHEEISSMIDNPDGFFVNRTSRVEKLETALKRVTEIECDCGMSGCGCGQTAKRIAQDALDNPDGGKEGGTMRNGRSS